MVLNIRSFCRLLTKVRTIIIYWRFECVYDLCVCIRACVGPCELGRIYNKKLQKDISHYINKLGNIVVYAEVWNDQRLGGTDAFLIININYCTKKSLLLTVGHKRLFIRINSSIWRRTFPLQLCCFWPVRYILQAFDQLAKLVTSQNENVSIYIVLN